MKNFILVALDPIIYDKELISIFIHTKIGKHFFKKYKNLNLNSVKEYKELLKRYKDHIIEESEYILNNDHMPRNCRCEIEKIKKMMKLLNSKNSLEKMSRELNYAMNNKNLFRDITIKKILN